MRCIHMKRQHTRRRVFVIHRVGMKDTLSIYGKADEMPKCTQIRLYQRERLTSIIT